VQSGTRPRLGMVWAGAVSSMLLLKRMPTLLGYVCGCLGGDGKAKKQVVRAAMNRVMQNDGRFCFAPGSMYRGDGEVEGLKSAVSCEILSGTMAEDHA